VGSTVVSAPIGSVAIAALSLGSAAASATPKPTRMTGAMAPRRPADDAPGGDASRKVTGVVGAGVHPAEAERGGGEDQRAEQGRWLVGRRGGRGLRAVVQTSDRQRDVADGKHGQADRQPGLQPHDRLEPEATRDDDHRGDHQERDDLRGRTGRPTEPSEDGGRRQRGQRDEHRLPADEQEVRGGARQRVAVHAESGPRQHHRWRGTPLAGQAHQADEQEREHRPEHPGRDRLRNADAEAEQERAVADREYRDVGGTPGPEEVASPALPLVLGDDVDAVVLDLEGRTGRVSS
jgi:hypothetical protein